MKWQPGEIARAIIARRPGRLVERFLGGQFFIACDHSLRSDAAQEDSAQSTAQFRDCGISHIRNFTNFYLGVTISVRGAEE